MPNPLSLDEATRLVEFLANDPPPQSTASRRDAAAVLLGLHGLRIEEVCRLRIDDWQEHQKTLRVQTLKGGPQAKIPVNDEAAKAIRRHLKTRPLAPPGAPLLATRTGRPVSQRNLRRRWSTWCRRAIGRHVRFHDLRHSCAQIAKAKGADLATVQALLRHANITTTREHYWGAPDQLRAYLP